MVKFAPRRMGILVMVSLVGVAIAANAASTRVEALPQYAAATGQACGTCHVNPAGGGPRNATGQAFEAIPTHATDPAGAFAQATAPAPAPAPAPVAAPAPSSQVTVSISGAATDDSVIYEMMIRNTGSQPLGNVYLAGAIPDGTTFASPVNTPVGSTFYGSAGGSAAWIVASVPAKGSAGPFGYKVSKGSAQDLSADAFAHWLAPTDGTAQSPAEAPLTAAEKLAVDQAINDKLNTADNSLNLWSLQPGNGPRMLDLARDINLAWFAGQANNWTMALYEMDDQLPSDVAHLKVRNPGIAPSMSNFQTASIKPVVDAIKAKDGTAFTASFDNMIAGCNSCHAGREDSKSVKIIRPTAPMVPEIDFSGNQ